MTFTRYRKSIWDFSPVRRLRLATLIWQYARPEIVRQHTLNNGAHGGGGLHLLGIKGEGGDFFKWHREYLKGLEVFLAKAPPFRAEPGPAGCARIVGGLARLFGTQPGAEAVLDSGPLELPSWRPWEPVPLEFLVPPQERGFVHPPIPPVSEVEFAPWSSENVARWRDLNAMGFALSWGPHFRVHFTCGGEMAIIPRAPVAPLFWPWHAFIDEIYEDWLRRTRDRAGARTASEWPWSAEQPEVRECHEHPEAGRHYEPLVPWCYGHTLDGARELIRNAHLVVGEERGLSSGSDIVRQQNPLPLTALECGAEVSLSGNESESGWPRPPV
jgi:hypothetical protein